jgi:serine/threonine-protein kinase
VLKILDFGISKISTSSVLTKSQTLVGSPYYMSPEQLESAQDVDQRADIWALGVIMYELYAGRRPFEGDSLAALCVSVLNATPEPLSDSTDQAFCEVVTKCLRKERKQRYQNVGELAQALEALRPQESHGAAARVTKVLQNARTVPDMPRPESDAAPERSASWAQTNREVSARRRTTKRFVLAVAVLAGAAFVGIGLGRLARAPLAEGTALGNAPSAEPAIGLAESLTSSQPEPANSTEVSPAVAEAVEVPTGTASASSSASSVPAAPNGPALHKVTAAKQNPPAAASANGPGEAPRFKALAPKPPPESKPGNDPARDPFLRRY